MATRLAREECDPLKSSRILKLGTREDGCGLLERLNLVIAAGLANLKILHDKIAAGVQLTIGLGEVRQLLNCVIIALSVLDEVFVGLGLLLGLFDDLRGLVLNGAVAVLDKVLVSLLRILFSNNGFVLHGLGIVNDGLDHALDTTCLLVLAVILETCHWRLWFSCHRSPSRSQERPATISELHAGLPPSFGIPYSPSHGPHRPSSSALSSQ